MNVKWEDVKADYARKDAEIERLKVMNSELMEALKIAATAMDLKVLSACEITDVYCALANDKELDQ